MFCPNCGNDLEEGAAFCPSCGAPVEKPQGGVVTEVMPSHSSFPAPTVTSAAPVQPVSDAQPQEEDLSAYVTSISEPEPEPEVSYTEGDIMQVPPPAGNYSAPYQNGPVPVFVPPVPKEIPARSNILMGALGSVVFSLIGCVIWVIIGSLGYISYLGGVAMALCCVMGYKLLGKKFDVPGFIVSLVVMLAAVLFSNVFIYSIQLVSDADILSLIQEWGYNGLPDVVFRFFPLMKQFDIMLEYYGEEAEMMSSFMSDLGISCLFSGIAFFVIAFSMLRASKNDETPRSNGGGAVLS